jgi:hypothetical protein
MSLESKTNSILRALRQIPEAVTTVSEPKIYIPVCITEQITKPAQHSILPSVSTRRPSYETSHAKLHRTTMLNI